MDLKTQIEYLAKLQTIDSEIYALRKEKELKPEEIKVLDLAFQELKNSLSGTEKVSLDLQKQKKDRSSKKRLFCLRIEPSGLCPGVTILKRPDNYKPIFAP